MVKLSRYIFHSLVRSLTSSSMTPHWDWDQTITCGSCDRHPHWVYIWRGTRIALWTQGITTHIYKVIQTYVMCTRADVPSQSVAFLPAQQLYTCMHRNHGGNGGWKPLENFMVKNKDTLLTTCRLNKMQMARQTGSERWWHRHWSIHFSPTSTNNQVVARV